MTKQKGHTLPVMRSSTSLRQPILTSSVYSHPSFGNMKRGTLRRRNINLLQLGALLSLLGERYRVRGDDFTKGVAVIEGFERVAGEDAVRDQGDDLRGAVFAEGVGGFGEGAAGVW